MLHLPALLLNLHCTNTIISSNFHRMSLAISPIETELMHISILHYARNLTNKIVTKTRLIVAPDILYTILM